MEPKLVCVTETNLAGLIFETLYRGKGGFRWVMDNVMMDADGLDPIALLAYTLFGAEVALLSRPGEEVDPVRSRLLEFGLPMANLFLDVMKLPRWDLTKWKHYLEREFSAYHAALRKPGEEYRQEPGQFQHMSPHLGACAAGRVVGDEGDRLRVFPLTMLYSCVRTNVQFRLDHTLLATAVNGRLEVRCRGTCGKTLRLPTQHERLKIRCPACGWSSFVEIPPEVAEPNDGSIREVRCSGGSLSKRGKGPPASIARAAFLLPEIAPQRFTTDSTVLASVWM